MKEREEKKINILMKVLVVRERKRKKAEEEIFKILEAKVDIKEVKRIGGEEGREMVVRMGSEEQKKEIIRKKWRLKGRMEIIMKDCIWGKRKMRKMEIGDC